MDTMIFSEYLKNGWDYITSIEAIMILNFFKGEV